MFAKSPALLPVINDLASGQRYLASLNPADAVNTESQLAAFLDVLLAEPLEPPVLFALLEEVREPLCFVEEVIAQRYHDRAVPLGRQEAAAFEMVADAWRKMGKAYAFCAKLQAAGAGPAQSRETQATILQRCIYYTGMLIIEHYRARREVPVGIWRELHDHYAAAEEANVAVVPVRDSLQSTSERTHCLASYVALLLIDAASPYSNGALDLNLIRRWATLWAPLVGIHRPEPGAEVGYVVELSRDMPLHPATAGTALASDVRHLDSRRMSLQIASMLEQLRKRISPSQLGLGEESASHITRLLEQLVKPWSLTVASRKFRRFAAEGTARVASNFDAMYFHIVGEALEQPDSASAYGRSEFDQLFTFRDRAGGAQSLVIKERTAFPHEEWAVINHSAAGFRLGRSESGRSLRHGQVIAVKPHDGEQYLLACITWLMQERSGGLIIGVATLPGVPQGVAVRVLELDDRTAKGRYVEAFRLPALPAIREEASLVLPSGVYQASRAVELRVGNSVTKVRMNRLLQRGTDFDRISFSAI